MALFWERGGLLAAFSDRWAFLVPSSEGPGPHTGCLPSRRGRTGPCISRGGASLVLFPNEMTLIQLTLEQRELEARGSTYPRVFSVNPTQSAVV